MHRSRPRPVLQPGCQGSGAGAKGAWRDPRSNLAPAPAGLEYHGKLTSYTRVVCIVLLDIQVRLLLMLRKWLCHAVRRESDDAPAVKRSLGDRYDQLAAAVDCQEAAARTTSSKCEIPFAGNQSASSPSTGDGPRKDLGDARFSPLKKRIWCPVHSTHITGGETDGTAGCTIGVFNYGADQEGNLRGARRSVYRLRRGRDVVESHGRNEVHTLLNRSDMQNLWLKVQINLYKRGLTYKCVPPTLQRG